MSRSISRSGITAGLKGGGDFSLYNGTMAMEWVGHNGAAIVGPAGPAGQKAGVRLTPEKDVRSNILSSA